MTKQEKKIVYAACERLAQGKNLTSCGALEIAGAQSMPWGDAIKFKYRYADFYAENVQFIWWRTPDTDVRIIALLLWAEAEGDI